jgi:hypothetical protein
MVELAAGMVNHVSRSAYKQELEGLRVGQTLPSVNEAMEDILKGRDTSTTPLPKGWALRVRKSSAVFSENLRTYLTSKFDVGVKTGRKLDPKTVAKQMRNQFPKDEWLTWGQIASYWSRLARLQRGETIADLEDDTGNGNGEGSQTTNACEEDIEDDPHFNTLHDDIHDGIEENAKHIFRAWIT